MATRCRVLHPYAQELRDAQGRLLLTPEGSARVRIFAVGEEVAVTAQELRQDRQRAHAHLETLEDERVRKRAEAEERRRRQQELEQLLAEGRQDEAVARGLLDVRDQTAEALLALYEERLGSDGRLDRHFEEATGYLFAVE